jgi:hypothetical protein
MRFLVFLAVAVALGVYGCFSDKAEETKRLEARIASLETELASAKEARTRDDGRMADCLIDAESAYWRFIELNGRRRPGTTDVWLAPDHIWNTAAANKANDIVSCKSLYAQR